MMADRREDEEGVVHSTDDRVMACPVCLRQMELQTKGSITIDVCPEHGIWLDEGELDALLMHLRHRLGKRSRRAVRSARKSGKVSGAAFGWWSLLFE